MSTTTTTTTTPALVRVGELQEAVHAAEGEFLEATYTEELARAEPARLVQEISRFFVDVEAGRRPDDVDERERLERELAQARNAIATDPRTGEKVVLRERARQQVIRRERIEPAQRELRAFVIEHRDELIAELMSLAAPVRERVLTAARELAAAIGAHREMVRAWWPFLEVWGQRGVYDGSSNWETDLPRDPGEQFATLDVKVELPAPRSLVALLADPDDKKARNVASELYGGGSQQ